MHNKKNKVLNFDIKVPSGLLQKIQNDYISSNYEDGVFMIQSIKDETILIILKSFLAWSEESGHLKENKIDIDFIERKK